MDCSPPGSSVHGIFQARALEWIAISFCLGDGKNRKNKTIVLALRQHFLDGERTLKNLLDQFASHYTDYLFLTVSLMKKELCGLYLCNGAGLPLGPFLFT